MPRVLQKADRIYLWYLVKVPPNLLSQSGNLFYSELLGVHDTKRRQTQTFFDPVRFFQRYCISLIFRFCFRRGNEISFEKSMVLIKLVQMCTFCKQIRHLRFYKYAGEATRSGYGGTDLIRPYNGLMSKNGVETRVLPGGLSQNLCPEEVRACFDGAFIDGWICNTPRVLPYCKMLWILTPGGSDEYLKEIPMLEKLSIASR